MNPLRAIADWMTRRAAARSPARVLVLETERGGHFFSWFALTESGEAVQDGAAVWHTFRPGGEAFHTLVALSVRVDAGGRILDARLGVARAFLDDRTRSAFARDIARSFLDWILPKPLDPGIAALVANIGDVTAGGTRVIMRAGAHQAPPPDRSGGYVVFCGQGSRLALALPPGELAFSNFNGPLPAAAIHAAASTEGEGRWLRIDVRTGV